MGHPIKREETEPGQSLPQTEHLKFPDQRMPRFEWEQNVIYYAIIKEGEKIDICKKTISNRLIDSDIRHIYKT